MAGKPLRGMRNSAPPAESRVFVSYRREDSAGHVLALLPALRAHYGAKRVFKDTDDIPAGADFLKFIQHELASCSVFLAIIGREWLTIKDPRFNRRRLDNPDDFLRVEVATALKNERIRVIPVLVERATMPSAEDLPPDLVELAFRQAMELSDGRWESDVERLIQAIDDALASALSYSGRVKATVMRHILAVANFVRSTSRQLLESSGLRRLAATGTIVLSTSATLLYYGPAVWPGSSAGTTPHSIAPSVPTVPRPSDSVPTNETAETPDKTFPAPEVARETQLEQHRNRARDLLRLGRRSQALDAIAAGLALDSTDDELQQLRDSMLTSAERSSQTAKTRARSAGAETKVADIFAQALGLEEEAERNSHGNVATAIRTYWHAAERFDRAAKRAGDAAKSPPPPVGGPPRDDRAQIRDVIAQYERGYNNMNVTAIRAVYPVAPDYLQKEFDKYIKYGLTILCPDDVKLAPDGATATAKCRLYHVMQPKDLATKIPQAEARREFVFQKRDGQWTISTLRSW